MSRPKVCFHSGETTLFPFPYAQLTTLSSTAAVESFRKEQGPKLHAELLASDKANKHTSYISGPWYAMYLEDRVPLPINYNPQITMNDSPVAAKNKQAERAASLIAAG